MTDSLKIEKDVERKSDLGSSRVTIVSQDAPEQSKHRERRRESRRQRAKSVKLWCRNICKFVFSTVGLSGLVVGYTLLGGVVFPLLERPNEMKRKHEITQQKNDTILRLVRAHRSHHNATGAAVEADIHRLLSKYTKFIVSAVQKHGWDGGENQRDLQWSFAGGLLYSVTVITTIGYGHVAPKTDAGKIATIIYASFGIPLMFLYLSNVGDYLAKWFRLLYIRGCVGCYRAVRKAKKQRAENGESSTIIENQSIIGAKNSTKNSVWKSKSGTYVNKSVLAEQLDMGNSLNSNCSIKVHKKHEVVARFLPRKSPAHRNPRNYHSGGDIDHLLKSETSASFHRSVTECAPRKLHVEENDPENPNNNDGKILKPPLCTSETETSDSLPIVDKIDITEQNENIVAESDDKPCLQQSLSKSSEDNAIAEEQSLTPRGVLERDPVVMLDHSQSQDRSTVSDRFAESFHIRRISYYSVGSLDHGEYGKQADIIEHSVIPTVNSAYIAPITHPKRKKSETVPISLSLFVMIAYITCGALLFTIWEEKDYLKWSYFSFITLSTIGFGDIVPGTQIDSNNPKEKLIAVTVYVALGLSVFAMCFKLMQEEVIGKVKWCGKKIHSWRQKSKYSQSVRPNPL